MESPEGGMVMRLPDGIRPAMQKHRIEVSKILHHILNAVSTENLEGRVLLEMDFF